MRKTLFGFALAVLALSGLAMAYPPAQDLILGQQRINGQVVIGDSATPVAINGTLLLNNLGAAGTCTLNAASPSVCTATVRSGCNPICTVRGGTAAIAAGGVACAVSTTTLTATSANGATAVVSYLCF